MPVRNMSIRVEVGLISGRKANVQAALDETVGMLKRRAQVALGVGTGRLLDSSGCVLEGCALTKKSRVQKGDSLTLLCNTVQFQASAGAFSAILGDGSVLTWGDAGYAGDSSAVQSQLQTEQQIQDAGSAFAAILDDGSVVTCRRSSRMFGRFKALFGVPSLPFLTMDPS